MKLDTGRHYLAVPGPSVMPDRVLAAMHRAAPNIYAGELPEMVSGLYEDLKAVARTRHQVAVYISNGHGAWEAANANMFSPGDTALVLVTGRFGENWARAAEAVGIKAERIDFGLSAPVDAERVAEALKADSGHRIKVVLMTHVDTATSVRNDVAAVRAAIDAAGHPALLAVDCIASLACDRYEMDAWGVDITVGACQKGLMTPPGLAFIWLSDKAREVCATSRLRTPYWDWTTRIEAEEFYQLFCGTAPTHHLYGLREALTMIEEEGLEAAWQRHERLANAVWTACDAWGRAAGREAGIGLNITEPAHRSHAVTTVRFTPPHARDLREWLSDNAGVTLGLGIGMAPPGDPAAHGFFRIAHMGHVNTHMTLGLLGSIEAGMAALGIAHGKGALEAAAAVLAGQAG